MEFQQLVIDRFGEPAGLAYFRVFGTSVALGLLIGLERERHAEAVAGLRTFALTALLGAVMAMLAEMFGATWLLPAGFATVGAVATIAHLHDRAEVADPGTTTTIALMVCFGLGALVWGGYSQVAAPLAVVVTVLLYVKPELRGLSERITRRDLASILQLGVLSLVILPVLPDRGYGPHGAVNPYQVWLMVVLISGVSLSGYLALRMVGAQHGAALVGLFGGLVSSTATTLLHAREAGREGGDPRIASLVVLLACSVVFARLAVLCAITAPALLPTLWPLLVAGALPLLVASLLAWRQLSDRGPVALPEVKNPAELRVSLGFGAMYAAVLLLASVLSHELGSKGLYALALASGLTDVDAVTLSGMQLFGLERIDAVEAATAIALALLSNTVLKAAMAMTVGGRAFARRIAGGFAGSAAALVAVAAAMQAGAS